MRFPSLAITAGQSPRNTQRLLRLVTGGIITAGALLFVVNQAASLYDRWSAALPAGEAAALEAGMIAALATAIGALPALFMRGALSERTRNALLGFSAGVMLAASVFSLLLPAIDYGAGLMADRASATLLVGMALAVGVAAMLFIERHTPHRHEDEAGAAERRSVLLMVTAIAIHNFPEGLAIGAAVSGAAEAAGQAVTWAIALQDLPEGLVVAVSLAAVGMARWRAFAIGAASGLAEPLAAVLSNEIIGLHPVLYPIGLALAAGAMLFVVSHEMIPGTHRRGAESIPTVALTAGFVVMMILDSSLV